MEPKTHHVENIERACFKKLFALNIVYTSVLYVIHCKCHIIKSKYITPTLKIFFSELIIYNFNSNRLGSSHFMTI